MEKGALLEFWQYPLDYLRLEMGMSGNFLSCIKGVHDPFKAQEERWDFSLDAAVEKGLISR